MKRLTITFMLLGLMLSASAQTAREEIKANKYLSASNYLDYDNYPATAPLTPTPKGYEPYLMNHYGRHGSRWLTSESSYTDPLATLCKAQEQDKLTAVGEDVLRQVKFIHATSIDRTGDLTTVGERQHHGIGRRMAQNFPEIFKKPGVPIDARSTVVIRCILSMEAECEELAAANPTARFHNDVSQALQYYLNQPNTPFLKSIRQKTREMRREHERSFIKNTSSDRLAGVLFNDMQWVADSIRMGELMYQLFDVAANMQSHDYDLDLYSLFTPEEMYQQWRERNIRWYLNYAASPQGNSLQPFSQANLLKDIIHVADTTRQTAAVLRFGHEVCVLPLACLLELGNCGLVTDDLENLDATWRNYNIFPMACNIQLVFYRPVSGKGDILVKALLNEREISLPAKTAQYPYYKWKDLRQHYLERLQWYEQQENKYKEESGQ